MSEQIREWSMRIYRYLVDEENTRVCKDIPEQARESQPRSFVLHLLTLVLTKWGDSLVSARLILPWIITATSVPAFFIAFLVPIREAMALVPQLFVAQKLREHPIRKWFWVAGSVGQGLCLALMMFGFLTFEGVALGWWIIGSLIVFSMSRGVCSVAIKDVMGKTVSKSRRGKLTGHASSVAGFLTVIAAMTIIVMPELTASQSVFFWLLGGSAGLWFMAAALYGFVPEVSGTTSSGGNAGAEAIKSLSLIKTDAPFRHFVMVRSLLIASAFAIPYIVVLVQKQDASTLSTLGGLMLASGAAGLVAGCFWGKWSDKASHHVMAAAAALAALVMIATIAIAYAKTNLLGQMWIAGPLIFLAAVAHQGARIGRTTYLIDMATQDNRAQYTAVSNTIIGVLLLCGGLLGVIDHLFGSVFVLGFLAVIAGIAGGQALRLPSVSG